MDERGTMREVNTQRIVFTIQKICAYVNRGSEVVPVSNPSVRNSSRELQQIVHSLGLCVVEYRTHERFPAVVCTLKWQRVVWKLC